MSYSTIGAEVLSARHLATEGGATGAYAGGGVRIGFIPPTIIYARMRAIDAEARELNTLILQYVARALFRDAWKAWYAEWRAFFEKYRPDSEWWGTMAKLGAATYTEELAAHVEGKRIDLERFRAGYLLEKQSNGLPVPPPPTPQVLPPPEPPAPKSERPWWLPEIPWWGWVLGTVVVGGLVYSVYRQAKDVKARERSLRENVLPKLLGPDLAKAANASGDPGEEDGPGMKALTTGPLVSTDEKEAVYEEE